MAPPHLDKDAQHGQPVRFVQRDASLLVLGVEVDQVQLGVVRDSVKSVLAAMAITGSPVSVDLKELVLGVEWPSFQS